MKLNLENLFGVTVEEGLIDNNDSCIKAVLAVLELWILDKKSRGFVPVLTNHNLSFCSVVVEDVLYSLSKNSNQPNKLVELSDTFKAVHFAQTYRVRKSKV